MKSIPTKREVSPEFAAFSDRQDALRLEQSRLRAEARELDRKIRASASLSGNNTAREARAMSLVESQPVEENISDEKRLAQLCQRIDDIDAAIALLSQKIEFAGRKASQIIVGSVADTHKKLVADICSTLVAAHKANTKYHALADALNLDGVSWSSLIPSHPNDILGQPQDKYSNVALYLRSARDSGFIGGAEVPDELRE